MKDHAVYADIHALSDDMVNDLSKGVQDEVPNITYGAAANLTRLNLGLDIAFKGDQEKVANARSLILDYLVKDGVDWASNYHEAVVKSKYRPSYDRAMAAKVPPVDVIMANCAISRKEALAVVRAFKKQDAENAAPVTAEPDPFLPVQDSGEADGQPDVEASDESA